MIHDLAEDEHQAATADADPSVPVSLVIPVRDEAGTLARLIRSINAQTRPPAEVIFVDGGSTDATVAMIRREATTNPRYVLVEAEGGATPGRGRNIGVHAASQSWIAMTDAGITLEQTWLEELWLAHLDRPSAGVVYGNYEFDLGSFFEECAAVAYCDPKIDTPQGRIRGPVVVSLLIHERAFAAAGGFPDLRSGEDGMFLRALEAAGTESTWAPAATVWWQLRPDLLSTLRRFRTYSYANTIAGQEHFWHRKLARSYVPVAGGLALAAWKSPAWLAVPLLTLAGRTTVRIVRHREDMPGLHRPGMARLGVVAGILLASDAATALGWWQARRHARAQRGVTGVGGPAPAVPQPASIGSQASALVVRPAAG